MIINLFNLQPVESNLNGVTCVQAFDKTKLELLLKSKLVQQEERSQLKHYLRNNGKVVYNRTSEFGRVWVKHNCGLQMIRREIRQTRADGYLDIDIVNCQPTILNQILLLHNYAFKSLK